MELRRMATFATAALALAASVLGAEAKSVRYEIDGEAYSYSTNNREQTETARQRIKAAEAAAAAKARAEAELAANPLAKVFGSPVQNEAKEARARLDQALAASEREASARPAAVSVRAERKVERAPVRRAAREPAPARRPAPVATASAAAAPERPEPKRREPIVSPASTGSTAPARTGPDAIVFDLASGIKTTHLPDGTVQEDLFDPAEIARVKAGSTPARTRISVVNERQPTAVDSASESAATTASAKP